MDIATLIGLIFCCIAVIGSIIVSGDLPMFIDLPSFIVVGFGILGATFAKWPFEVIVRVSKVVGKAFFSKSINSRETIEEIVRLAEVARKESIFALEKQTIKDSFMKKAMTLAADNRPPDTLRSILQLDIDAMEERHRVGISVFQGMAEDGPAFGMMGTLIGLVIMLSNLSDQAAIGPAMAVALLTTFYGACIANIFCHPIKNKLNFRSKEEIIKMSIIVDGTLGIVAGENPRLIREKLNSFLFTQNRQGQDRGEG